MSDSIDRIEWMKYEHLFERIEIPARTFLLREGEVANHTYLLEKGCIRIWFNHAGKDITLNFFFEGEGVSSVESFRMDKPSDYYLETLEPCIVHRIEKKNFRMMLNESPIVKRKIEEVTFDLLFSYRRLFLSIIKDSPEVRYEELVRNRPEIVRRVPQRLIASYLGITPVSLSRIRNKRK